VQSPAYRADKARTTLDGGVLGVVAVSIDSAVQAAGLLRGRNARGLARLSTGEVVIDADSSSIPVGIDGEALSLPTPVRCRVRPKALRVRVPRNRPGVPLPKPPINWRRLRQLAL
jgi:diacylglycerol kinase family enzyme